MERECGCAAVLICVAVRAELEDLPVAMAVAEIHISLSCTTDNILLTCNVHVRLSASNTALRNTTVMTARPAPHAFLAHPA